MKLFKRFSVGLLAVLMLLTCLTGCSTPPVAMTIGDYEVSTGEYLANLYTTFYNVYVGNGLYYYTSYGYTMDQIWDMEQTYGEGDDAVKLKLADYIKQATADSLIRQQAIKKLMNEYNITLSDDDRKEIDEQMKNYDEAEYLKLGFNRENYLKALTAISFEEAALFYGLYEEGGKYGVPNTDVRQYFEDNYLVYKTFTLSLVDSEGADLKEADAQKVKDQMNTYLDMYKSGKSIDEVYKKYLADEEAKKAASTTTTTKKGSTTTTKKGQTTTTAPTTTTTTTVTTTTTTAAPTTTTATGATGTTAAGGTTTTATGSSSGSGSTSTNTENTLSFSTLNAAAESANADLVKALKGLKHGEAQLVTYSPSDKNKLIAFVVRYDHSDDYKSKDEYYEDAREGVLYNMRTEEFEKLLKTPIKELEAVTVKDDRAIRMCDPKKFAS